MEIFDFHVGGRLPCIRGGKKKHPQTEVWGRKEKECEILIIIQVNLTYNFYSTVKKVYNLET